MFMVYSNTHVHLWFVKVRKLLVFYCYFAEFFWRRIETGRAETKERRNYKSFA